MSSNKMGFYKGGSLLEQVIDREYIEAVYRGAKEVFCDGIYVKSDQHPCGWDFISLEDLECSEDAFSVGIEIHSISGGNYYSSEFEDNTMEEIIKKVGVDGWCFELSGADDLK